MRASSYFKRGRRFPVPLADPFPDLLGTCCALFFPTRAAKSGTRQDGKLDRDTETCPSSRRTRRSASFPWVWASTSARSCTSQLMLALFICVECYHLRVPDEQQPEQQYLVVAKFTYWLEREPYTVYSWCEKSDDDYKKETISIISDSAGTRCNNNMTSSFYNCPTVCTFYTWDGQIYDDSRAWENKNSLCARHCRAACPTRPRRRGLCVVWRRWRTF